MSRKPPRIPSYRHHKGSGQAFVQVKGVRHYLGKYGTEGSQEKYRRFVAELLTRVEAEEPTPAPGRPDSGMLVVELCAAYWQFAEHYYTKDGSPTGHLWTVRKALKLLRGLYGGTVAADFGPLALRAIQETMIKEGRARGYINGVCGVIRRVFKWAASQELLPVTTYQAIATVPGLRKGRSAARETEPVGPVDDHVVEATLEHLGPVVADMVRFQRLTGCRPSEVCVVRPGDVDRSGDVWEYRPGTHKTEHLGRGRVILVGPKAQDVLTLYLLRAADAYCFSPAEAVEKVNREKRARRKTRVQPSQLNRRKRRPKRRPGARYTRDSYRTAIHRSCDLAGIERWSPNRLRHAAGTAIRKRYGLEAAQVVLGHAKADVTQIYAERDIDLARRVIREVG